MKNHIFVLLSVASLLGAVTATLPSHAENGNKTSGSSSKGELGRYSEEGYDGMERREDEARRAREAKEPARERGAETGREVTAGADRLADRMDAEGEEGARARGDLESAGGESVRPGAGAR